MFTFIFARTAKSHKQPTFYLKHFNLFGSLHSSFSADLPFATEFHRFFFSVFLLFLRCILYSQRRSYRHFLNEFRPTTKTEGKIKKKEKNKCQRDYFGTCSYTLVCLYFIVFSIKLSHYSLICVFKWWTYQHWHDSPIKSSTKQKRKKQKNIRKTNHLTNFRIDGNEICKCSVVIPSSILWLKAQLYGTKNKRTKIYFRRKTVCIWRSLISVQTNKSKRYWIETNMLFCLNSPI